MERHLAQRELDGLFDAHIDQQRQADELNQRNNDAPQNVPNANPVLVLDNADGQPAAIINLSWKYKLLPVYFFVGFSFLGGYLFISYALTSLTGYLLNFVYLKMIITMLNGVSILLSYLQLPEYHSKLISEFSQISNIENWFIRAVISPLSRYYYGYVDGTMRDSIIIRIIPLASTYLTFIFICCKVPEILSKGHSKKNPLKNSFKRSLFSTTYIIKCTLKVLTLFTLELAGFPIMAGFMIDVSLISPLLLPQSQLTFFPKFFKVWPPATLLAYWAVGTLYMYWFAQYVGMVRQYIIRSGVLFFIRSPDDPNIQLLQDSLIYPMELQLSRLGLSMFIYTTFILLGFGFHTRFLLPYVLKSELLPMKHPMKTFLDTYSFVSFFLLQITYVILTNQRVINIYVRQYWVYIFDLCCRKIRLSSFILNKDSPTERGHVIYRNIFYKLFYSNRAKMSNLELYSQPKSLEESKRLFKQNPHIHAYFVPDGNMMRVPSNDIISKKYVQFLFVPVTKDDKLLQPLDIDRIQKRQKLNAGEFGYLENQSTEFDEYKVVYVPPHFTLTYSLLIVFIWLFASILIIGVLLAANICGLPVTAFIQFTLHYFQLSKAKSQNTFIELFKSLNLFSICFGLLIISMLIALHHNYLLNNVNKNERIVDIAAEENNENNGDQENENLVENMVQIDPRPAPAMLDRFNALETIRNFWNGSFGQFMFANLLLYGLRYLTIFNHSYHSLFLLTLFKTYYLEDKDLKPLLTSDKREFNIKEAVESLSHLHDFDTKWILFFLLEVIAVSYITISKSMKPDEVIDRRKLAIKVLKYNISFFSFILAVPMGLQTLICMIEYYTHPGTYTSVFAPYIYFTLVIPFTSTVSSNLTLVQQASFLYS